MPTPAIFTVTLTLLWMLISSSCSHYSRVPVDAAPFKTIYVHTISNQDFAPNIHTLFQNQIRQTILRDNRLTITNNPQQADTQLYLTIEDYNRSASTRSSVDAGRFNSLSLQLVISISLYDNETDSYLLENVSLSNSKPVFFDPVKNSINHREIEYQTLPKITKDLSRDILELILSDWKVSVD